MSGTVGKIAWTSLALMCLFSVGSISVAGSDASDSIREDVNSDGSVNVLDIVGIVAFIVGSTEAQYGCDGVHLGDINQDDGVNVLDIVSIVSYIVGSSDGNAKPTDGDGDTVCDDDDNCPSMVNGGQADTDGDGAGDTCDPWPDCYDLGIEPYDSCGVCNGSGGSSGGDLPDGACDCEGTMPLAFHDCDGQCLEDPDGDSLCSCCDGPFEPWLTLQENLYCSNCVGGNDAQCDSCVSFLLDIPGGGNLIYCQGFGDLDSNFDQDFCSTALSGMEFAPAAPPDACGACVTGDDVSECGACAGQIENLIPGCIPCVASSGGSGCSECSASLSALEDLNALEAYCVIPEEIVCDPCPATAADKDECGVCGGPGIAEGACDCTGNVDDCTGQCGGSAALDECGVCEGDGILSGTCDCAGNLLDCMGECGGAAVANACGVCDGGEVVMGECGCAGDFPEGFCDCDGLVPGNPEDCCDEGFNPECIDASQVDSYPAIIGATTACLTTTTNFNNGLNDCYNETGSGATSTYADDMAVPQQCANCVLDLIMCAQNTHCFRNPVNPSIDFDGDGTIDNTYCLDENGEPLTGVLPCSESDLPVCTDDGNTDCCSNYVESGCTGNNFYSPTLGICVDGVLGGDYSGCVGCVLAETACYQNYLGCVEQKGVYDQCDVCGGDGLSCLDACGMPNGDGSSCAGCDGISNSGLVNDACGICDGPNTSLPADGEQCAAALDVLEVTPSSVTFGLNGVQDMVGFQAFLSGVALESAEAGGAAYLDNPTETDGLENDILIAMNTSSEGGGTSPNLIMMVLADSILYEGGSGSQTFFTVHFQPTCTGQELVIGDLLGAGVEPGGTPWTLSSDEMAVPIVLEDGGVIAIPAGECVNLQVGFALPFAGNVFIIDGVNQSHWGMDYPLQVGTHYTFNVNTIGSHAFSILQILDGQAELLEGDSISGNVSGGVTSGTIEWLITADTPSEIAYQCASHSWEGNLFTLEQ